jgi:hypothetical protein
MVSAARGAGAAGSVRERLDGLDWPALAESILARGFVRTPRLLEPPECAALAALYADDRRFRKTVCMERHRFGVGEYRYFARPLPPLVRELRTHAYRRLAPVANRMHEALGRAERFPPSLAAFLRHCAARGQRQPTPLLLRYAAEGYNCLHRDLYGDVVFPLQLAAFLSRPGVDYEGGAFLLVESRARSQSIGEALVPGQGELVIFATSERPAPGRRGSVRATLRHGVARVTRGERTTLGVIFHDARS